MAKRKIDYDKIRFSKNHPSTLDALEGVDPFLDVCKQAIVEELIDRTPLFRQEAVQAVRQSEINGLLKKNPQRLLYCSFDELADDIYYEYQNSK